MLLCILFLQQVPDYLDTIIACLVNTVLLDWKCILEYLA